MPSTLSEPKFIGFSYFELLTLIVYPCMPFLLLLRGEDTCH
jgi:hypothetical protein